jgi:glyoxylase-like metal-dependent hydrolase (beta-lactamase superfamily II)
MKHEPPHRSHSLDVHFQGHPGLIAAHAIETADGWIIIDPGPGSCTDALLEALHLLSIPVEAVKQLYVTHVHLDHAGGAGWWAQRGVPVFCHPRAARHLAQPQQLLRSAAEIYGEKMDTLWGSMSTVPEIQLHPLNDGETVPCGGLTVTAWDTPGHARHHHAYLIGDVCFAGDVAGMRLAGTDYLSVTAAPPQFELEPYLQSVQRLREGKFRQLYLTHFGLVNEVDAHLAAYQQRLTEVYTTLSADLARGLNENEASRAYTQREHLLAQQKGITPPQWQLLEQTNSTTMCATGLIQAHTRQKKAR